MKNIIILFTFIFINRAFSYDCISKDEVNEVKNLENSLKSKVFIHKLYIDQNTCGARGCEIRVYSNIRKDCVTASYIGHGFYIENSLTPKELSVKTNAKIIKYNFDILRGTFE